MNIPTALEFLHHIDEETGTMWTEDDNSIAEKFVEFAKMHVQLALEAASINAKAEQIFTKEMIGKKPTVNKQSILSSYPLTNIK